MSTKPRLGLYVYWRFLTLLCSLRVLNFAAQTSVATFRQPATAEPVGAAVELLLSTTIHCHPLDAIPLRRSVSYSPNYSHIFAGHQALYGK